jgi:hypothetical protein
MPLFDNITLQMREEHIGDEFQEDFKTASDDVITEMPTFTPSEGNTSNDKME